MAQGLLPKNTLILPFAGLGPVQHSLDSVSYTHLTLPTNREV